MQLRFATFVFDRDDAPIFVKLDDIRFSADGVNDGYERKGTRDSHAPLGFIRTAVGDFVQDVSFCRELIVSPYLFEVNQCRPPLAIEQVIESRDRQGLSQIGGWHWKIFGKSGGPGAQCFRALVVPECQLDPEREIFPGPGVVHLVVLE